MLSSPLLQIGGESRQLAQRDASLDDTEVKSDAAKRQRALVFAPHISKCQALGRGDSFHAGGHSGAKALDIRLRASTDRVGKSSCVQPHDQAIAQSGVLAEGVQELLIRAF